ncbi:MAG: cation diffusion facilitator family transporter [Candidatus Zixiibacteriota bacterium]
MKNNYQKIVSQSQKDLSSGLKVTWLGIAVNIFLVIIKIYAGLIAKSQALVADGVHSLSDMFTDFVVLFGLKIGRKDEDLNHPYGHARIETISGMLVGVVLFIFASGLVYSSILSLYKHEESAPNILSIIIILTSIILKEGMYWYTLIISQRIRSMALAANAWHHRTDALSSVAVLFGVGGTYLNPDWHLADALAALFVTFFILKTSGSLIWTALKEVVDTAPDMKVITQLEETALKIDGVRQVHDIRARHSGGQIFVEMHIVINPEQTVLEGHKIAATVKHYLLNEITDVTRVIIHVDPEIKSE